METSSDLPSNAATDNSRRRRSSSKRRHKKSSRKLKRAMAMVASVVLLAASFFLFMYDSSLRQPGTDDTPGDPPTQFLVWALVAGLCGILCILAAVFWKRRQSSWDMG